MSKIFESGRPEYRLVPAAKFPARIEVATQDSGVEGKPRFELLDLIFLSGRPWDAAWPEFSGKPVQIHGKNPFKAVELALLQRLASGEEVHMESPFGRDRNTGRVRLMWGFCPHGGKSEDISRLCCLVLEFVPDTPVDGTLDEWRNLRFPDCEELHLACGTRKFPDLAEERAREAYEAHLYRLWFEETKPPRGLRPDDGLLYRAVVDNREHLVTSILACQGPIAMPADAITSVEETALGVAMENAGTFRESRGYMSGCHRNYREDDFTMAEDSKTWVPRALRIADLLRAAGAVDYSPLLNACAHGDVDGVRTLLESGFPPNFAVYGHTTPLTSAVAGGHVEICRLLLQQKAGPNLRTPFEAAMTYGGPLYPLSLALSRPAIAKMLLDAGARPDAEGDDEFLTPAVFAGRFLSAANAAAVFTKVDFGEVKNSRGQTGTHLLDAESLRSCRDFVPSWQLDALDAQGQTPLLLALSRGDAEKAALLLELGACPDTQGLIWEFRSHRSAIHEDEMPLILTPVQAALVDGELPLLEQLLKADGKAMPVALSVERSIEVTPNEADSIAARVAQDRKMLELGDDLPSLFFLRSRNIDCVTGDAPASLEPIDDEGVAQILAMHPDPLARYPELVREVDLLEMAKEAGLRRGLIATFEAGRPLTAREWLECATDSIDEAKEAVDQLATRLREAEPASEDAPHARSLLSAIDRAEDDLDRARAVIPGLEPLRRNLSAEICGKAAADFDGGAARARRDASADGGIDFDDFLDGLKENLSPGSTMDFGKLLQAARATIAQLDRERAALMRQA